MIRETRQFIRHPTDIPIAYSCGNRTGESKKPLKNINESGLCFGTRASIETGTPIRISIAVSKPPFKAKGEVVWCRPANGRYEVGVRFEDAATAFAVRMVEQICHIERYKTDVLRLQGRRLSTEEAADEWIRKYADDFPDDQ